MFFCFVSHQTKVVSVAEVKHSLINLCVCVPLQSHMISVYLSMTQRHLTLVNPFATELTTAITVCSEVSLPLQRLSTPNPSSHECDPAPFSGPLTSGCLLLLWVSPSSSWYQKHVSPVSHSSGWDMPLDKCAARPRPLKPVTPVSPPAFPPVSEAAGRWGASQWSGNPSTSGGGSQTCPAGWWFRRSGRTPRLHPGTEHGPAEAARSAETRWRPSSSPSAGLDAPLEATNPEDGRNVWLINRF